LTLPSKLKRGTYKLTLDIVDQYGRRLKLVQKVRVTR
jgi:hypothetical protein